MTATSAPAPAGGPTILEAAIRRDRLFVAAGLAGAILLSWAYLVPASLDMYGSMDGLSAWMMTAAWDVRYAALIFLMWSVMMLGMMLPSAAPAILLFARTVRNTQQAHFITRTYAFAGGYLLAWTGFSAAATAAQWLLARAALINPMMEVPSRALGAAILIAAGLYQLTPLKRMCLTHCRSPLHWLSHNWRHGVTGAIRMGMSHGIYCVGCCWAIMLLLFVGGVMNLLWIALITVLVLLEKLAPRGAAAGRVGGGVLIAAGIWLLAAA